MKKQYNYSKLVLVLALFTAGSIQPVGFDFLTNPSAQKVEDWQNSPYFNTKFLSKYDQVTERLMKVDNFVEGFFKTEDNHKINYLYLERPNARYTTIFCGGFIPGRKEGLASYFAMLPNDCNILFFDARGHGKSDGDLSKTVWKYGTQEYKDIVAATKFAHKKSPAPIIIHGTCAGAFHATHAILELQRKKILDVLNVKGLVFDSGWGSVKPVSYSAPHAEAKGVLLKKFAALYRTKNLEEVKKRWLYRGTAALLKGLAATIHFCIVKPTLSINEYRTKLTNKMHNLQVPVLFIHSENDEHAPIMAAKQLASQVKSKQTWWITQKSKHACHNFKFKQDYKNKMLDFVESAIK